MVGAFNLLKIVSVEVTVCCPRVHSNIIAANMKDELRAQESLYSLEIRKISEERDRAVREVAVQKTFVDETAERVNDLDQSCRELKNEVEAQAHKYGENLARIARGQEKVSVVAATALSSVACDLGTATTVSTAQAYDALHSRLETMWGERDTLLHRVVEAEHTNHQLLSFLLMEGLQLPDLQPASRGLHERVADMFPAGESRFEEGVKLTATQPRSAWE